MPKYVIERDIPGAGKMSPTELSGASAKSCSVLDGLGNDIQWIHSYVTDDKIYCVYTAPSEDLSAGTPTRVASPPIRFGSESHDRSDPRQDDLIVQSAG